MYYSSWAVMMTRASRHYVVLAYHWSVHCIGNLKKPIKPNTEKSHCLIFETILSIKAQAACTIVLIQKGISKAPLLDMGWVSTQKRWNLQVHQTTE